MENFYTVDRWENMDGTYTSEYRLSDGSRYVKLEETYVKKNGQWGTRTRVLYSEFEGDHERRSTLKALEAAIDGLAIKMFLN